MQRKSSWQKHWMQITYSHISSRTLTRSHKKWSTFSTIRETRLNYPKQYAGITWQRPSNSWRIQSFMLVNPMDRVLLLPPRARMEADFCEFENAQHKEYAFTTPDISISKRPLCWTRLICMKYGTTSRKNRHTCRSGISLVQQKNRTLQKLVLCKTEQKCWHRTRVKQWRGESRKSNGKSER